MCTHERAYRHVCLCVECVGTRVDRLLHDACCVPWTLVLWTVQCVFSAAKLALLPQHSTLSYWNCETAESADL